MTTAFVLAAAVVGLLALDRFAAFILTPIPKLPDRTVPDTGVAHEDLTIPSGDHELAAWLLQPRGESKRPIALLAHGWGANYSYLLQLAEPLVAEGYQLLLFDVRGHGRNEPVPVVTVRHFRDDVAAVVAYARNRFGDRPLVVIGHSLGGAAAVLAAAEGAPIDAIAMIASPSDVVQVTGEYLAERGLPGGRAVARMLVPFWWRRAGSTFGPLTPWRRIAELTIPVIVVHAEDDVRVRLHHSERLTGAIGSRPLVVEGRGHNDVLGAPETRKFVRDLLAGF